MLNKQASSPRSLLIIMLMVAGLIATACSPKEPIKFGFIGGIAGRVADLGQAGRNGFQLAVEQINAAGGIQGRRIEMIIKDDGQDPMRAKRAAEELVAAKVAVIIGPMTSAMVESVLPAATAAGIVVLSPTVTTTAMTGKDDLFLRLLADTRTYAEMSAEFGFTQKGVRRVAAVFDTRNRAYTESWLSAFRTSFTALGGKLVVEIPFESGDSTDHAALVKQMLDFRPDALLFVSGAVDTARFAQQVRQQGASQLLCAAEMSATERLIELGGRAVDGMYVAQQFDRNDTSPSYLEFVKAYQARFQSMPGFPSIEGYNAVYTVVEALKSSGEGVPLKQALLEHGPFPGVQQPIVFDRFGDSLRPAKHTIIRDGRFVLEK